MSETEEEDYAQGTWGRVKAEPRRIAGRKDGRAPHDFIDAAALGRLVKKYGRPDGTIDGTKKKSRDDEKR